MRDKAEVSCPVSLPGGCWRDGDSRQPVREVSVRPVGPQDDAFLLDSIDATPGMRGTALVARCLVDQANPEDFARSLTVGDREALLLHIRRLTLGDRIDARVRCPATACGERMDVTLTVESLLMPQYESASPEYTLTVESDGFRHEICFWVPRAADLAAGSRAAGFDADRLAGEILDRCLLTATRDGVPESVAELPETVRSRVGAAMLERDPQAELELDLTCPSCGAGFAAVLDTATFFLRELDERASRLIHEVHTLASRYHWSERAILRMPAQRRAQYLELVFAGTAGLARDGRSR
jgi:hypothetical protein